MYYDLIFCCVIDNASDFPKYQQKIELFRQSQKTIVFAFPMSLSHVDRSFFLNAEPIYTRNKRELELGSLQRSGAKHFQLFLPKFLF